ncbi:dihydrofolate reductase family protein [Flavitalea flava]
MRKIIVSMNITLDGFMADTHSGLDWHFQSWNQEMAGYAYEQLRTMDTIILGRLTYQAMAAYWPSAARHQAGTCREIEFAHMMNNYTKLVFSNTLDILEWKNARLVKGDISREMSRLGKEPGKDMVIFGSGSIVKTFHRLGLIDEFRLLVHPVILGHGKPLFKDILDKEDLFFLQTRKMDSGVVVLSYQPANNQRICSVN